jgi:hypothetical protein
MSYTQRNRNSNSIDDYPTPAWVTKSFIEAWQLFDQMGPEWLEPSVGDGHIIQAVNEFRSDIRWLAIDIRDTRESLENLGLEEDDIIMNQDFFELKFYKHFDVAILNPPFSRGIEFVKKCRQISDYMIVYQTLNFLGSEKRNRWLREDCPDIYVIPDRVSHVGHGKSDAIYSAWYVWTPERKHTGEFMILETTSDKERKACYDKISKKVDVNKTKLLADMFDDEDDE